MFENDEDNIGENPTEQNQQIREALIDYAESHYGIATKSSQEFIDNLQKEEFLIKASETLFDVINILYSAALTSSEEESSYLQNQKKFIFNTKRAESDFLAMRSYLINNYKQLEVEDNFSLNDILYNQRISNLQEIIKSYKQSIEK